MLKSDNAAKSEVEVVFHNLNLTYHIDNNDNAMKLIEIEHANEEIKKELDNVDIKKDTYFHEDSLIKELCSEDTNLMDAVREQRFDLVELLLDERAEVNYSDKFFRTPLLIAVRKQNLEIVKLLVERTEVKLFLENTAELNNYDRCWVNQLRWELQNTKRSEITKLFENHINFFTNEEQAFSHEKLFPPYGEQNNLNINDAKFPEAFNLVGENADLILTI